MRREMHFSYKTLNTTLIFEFDGNILNISCEIGKRYLKYNTLSYNKIEKIIEKKLNQKLIHFKPREKDLQL